MESHRRTSIRRARSAPSWSEVERFRQNLENAFDEIYGNGPPNISTESVNDEHSDFPADELLYLLGGGGQIFHEISNTYQEHLVNMSNLNINHSEPSQQRSKFDLLETLHYSLALLSELIQCSVFIEVEKLTTALKAEDIAFLRLSAASLTKNLCKAFNSELDVIDKYIREARHAVPDGDPPNERVDNDMKELMGSIKDNIKRLRAWDTRQSFLRGTSERFANVQTSRDLLPGSGDPVECGICLSIVKETDDFALQSDCCHIFCTPCLSTWFQEKKNCPMCRETGVWLSKNRLLELRSSSSGSGR